MESIDLHTCAASLTGSVCCRLQPACASSLSGLLVEMLWRNWLRCSVYSAVLYLMLSTIVVVYIGLCDDTDRRAPAWPELRARLRCAESRFFVFWAWVGVSSLCAGNIAVIAVALLIVDPGELWGDEEADGEPDCAAMVASRL